MQLENIDLDKNAIQRIESRQRFITDIELKCFAEVLNLTYEQLLESQDMNGKLSDLNKKE